MFYFYILFSRKDGKLYYGSSSDLRRRVREHTNGRVPSTRHRRPLTLLYYEAYCDKTSAEQREKKVKESGRIRTELKQRLGVT